MFLLLNLTRAFEPPWEYDSLEYHLASPAAYHRAGRVFFMRNNVYANFPQNTEMLYFLAMRVTESPDRGAQVGMLLGAAFGFLTALALGSMIAGLAGKEVGDAAAAMFYTWSGVTIYSGVPYVELPLFFYGTLALWGLLWSWRRRRTPPGARGWVWLAGIAAGLAMGVKYTAALLVFLPVLGGLLAVGLLRRVGWTEALRRAACFAGAALLLFSPWMIRNFVNTRNPVYPLMYRVFRSTNWDPQKDARWMDAHSPRIPRDLGKLVKAAGAQAHEALFFDERKASLLLLLFVPLTLLARKRTRGVILLLVAHQVLLFFLWFFFTQHNVRFLEAWIPAMAGLSALGLGAAFATGQAGGLRPLIIVLLLVAPPRWWNYTNVADSLGVALGSVSPQAYFTGPARIGFKTGYAAMQFINDPTNLPPGSKILFLGEARTFYCRRDHVAGTVFDDNVLEEIVNASKTAEDVRNGLKQRGITHLYVNTPELARLQESYRYPYRGVERLGMLDGFDWGLFGRFAEAYLEHVATFGGSGAEDFPWQSWNASRETAAAGGSPGRFIALYAVR